MADQQDPREDDPLAEADAVDCDAETEEAEFSPTERDAPANEAEASFREEVFEAFEPRDNVLVAHPGDGMPVPREEMYGGALAQAHPFTIETMVCVEDERQYVELFQDEAPLRKGGALIWTGWTVRTRHDDEGSERERRTFEPDEVDTLYGTKVAKPKRTPRLLVPVRPVRERCIFYKRQLMANDDVPDPSQPGHFLIFRNCTRRRSVGGAFMTLRDEAMYACDYREPPDPSSVEKHLDGRDRERLASKRHLEMVRPFNLSGGTGG